MFTLPPLPALQGLLPLAGTELPLRVVNHLLKREDWARARLGAHAGKTLRLDFGAPWVLAAQIDASGLLQAHSTPDQGADVQLSLDAAKRAALFSAWRSAGAEGVMGLVHIQGDAALAKLLAELAARLRPEPEAELAAAFQKILPAGNPNSVLVADMLGQGFGKLGKIGLNSGLSAWRRAQENLGHYLDHEASALPRQAERAALRAQAQSLTTRLDALHARLLNLEQRP